MLLIAKRERMTIPSNYEDILDSYKKIVAPFYVEIFFDFNFDPVTKIFPPNTLIKKEEFI